MCRQRESYYQKSGKSVEEIILCENDRIFEGGQSNFFAVKDNTVFTKGDGVLQGTVRNMVITICTKLGIPLSFDAPRLSEVQLWDACFITSTSRFIMNINTLRVVINFSSHPQENGVVLKEFTPGNKIVSSIEAAVANELKFE